MNTDYWAKDHRATHEKTFEGKTIGGQKKTIWRRNKDCWINDYWTTTRRLLNDRNKT